MAIGMDANMYMVQDVAQYKHKHKSELHCKIRDEMDRQLEVIKLLNPQIESTVNLAQSSLHFIM